MAMTKKVVKIALARESSFDVHLTALAAIARAWMDRCKSVPSDWLLGLGLFGRRWPFLLCVVLSRSLTDYLGLWNCRCIKNRRLPPALPSTTHPISLIIPIMLWADISIKGEDPLDRNAESRETARFVRLHFMVTRFVSEKGRNNRQPVWSAISQNRNGRACSFITPLLPRFRFLRGFWALTHGTLYNEIVSSCDEQWKKKKDDKKKERVMALDTRCFACKGLGKPSKWCPCDCSVVVISEAYLMKIICVI